MAHPIKDAIEKNSLIKKHLILNNDSLVFSGPWIYMKFFTLQIETVDT